MDTHGSLDTSRPARHRLGCWVSSWPRVSTPTSAPGSCHPWRPRSRRRRSRGSPTWSAFRPAVAGSSSAVGTWPTLSAFWPHERGRRPGMCGRPGCVAPNARFGCMRRRRPTPGFRRQRTFPGLGLTRSAGSTPTGINDSTWQHCVTLSTETGATAVNPSWSSARRGRSAPGRSMICPRWLRSAVNTTCGFTWMAPTGRLPRNHPVPRPPWRPSPPPTPWRSTRTSGFTRHSRQAVCW